MPLADAGTISKGYWGEVGVPCGVVAARNKPAGDNEFANKESPEVAASPEISSRRLSSVSRKDLRRLKVVAARLLRAPSVRRTLRGHLSMNRKFLFGLFALAGAAVG